MFALVPFLSYVLVATFTPGPNNIMSLSIAGRYGWRRALPFTLGVATGFALLMLLCAWANLLLYSVIPQVQLYMQVAGALYMAYLAFKILKSSSKAHAADQDDGSSDSYGSFWSGLALQFVNIKVILYGITVMGTFVIPVYSTALSSVGFALGLASMSFISTNCWALFGSLFQRFLARNERPFNIVMALLLVYCAVSLFLHQS